MGTKYLSIEHYDAYKASFELSNYVWKIVIQWNYFEKETVGKQFVRSIDSISANIAEGYGRFSKRDKIKFYYYSLASAMESKDWNNKCFQRSIIKQEEYDHIQFILDNLPKLINQLIQYTNSKLKY